MKIGKWIIEKHLANYYKSQWYYNIIPHDLTIDKRGIYKWLGLVIVKKEDIKND